MEESGEEEAVLESEGGGGVGLEEMSCNEEEDADGGMLVLTVGSEAQCTQSMPH